LETTKTKPDKNGGGRKCTVKCGYQMRWNALGSKCIKKKFRTGNCTTKNTGPGVI